MSASQPTSLARLEANRANAKLSTGPTSFEGKLKSSQNALKTGLTGRTVLLLTEDAKVYEEHILKFVEAFEPIGEMEAHLVQSLADLQWRLNRIPSLEAGMFALGRIKYAHLFEKHPDAKMRDHLLDAYIAQEDARHLKNLHLQESRLSRYYRQTLADLQARQKERKDREAEQSKAKDATAQTVGFEFTTEKTGAEIALTNPSANADPAARPVESVLPNQR